MRFDRHTVVLLVRPADTPELSEEEAAAVQDAHLASQADLHAQGYLVAAGPFDDQDDERLRGIAVMSVDAEQARRLYANDPAVRAGRLVVEVMTWQVPAGSVRFETFRPPRSMAEAGED